MSWQEASPRAPVRRSWHSFLCHPCNFALSCFFTSCMICVPMQGERAKRKKNASVQKASHTHTSINTACSGSGCLPRPTPVHWNSCRGLLLPPRGVLNLKQSVWRILWAEPGRGAHSCLSCHATVTSQVLLCHQGLPASTGAVILSLRVPDSHRWCYVPNGHQ